VTVLPARLTTHRFLIRRARTRAEAAYVAGAKAAYGDGWSILKTALQRVPPHEMTKAAGDPADPGVIAQVIAAMERQLAVGAGKAADALSEGENSWFADQGIEWSALEKDELLRAYQDAFAPIGGFKGIAQTAVEPIQGILTDYYADPGAGLPDLADALSGYFAPYKAQQVGITETTRMGAVNAEIVADRVDAERAEWDSSEDAFVCSVCAGLDGQAFDLNGQQDPPPAHTGCRCSWAILIEE
jgi:hypothetical protein